MVRPNCTLLLASSRQPLEVRRACQWARRFFYCTLQLRGIAFAWFPASIKPRFAELTGVASKLTNVATKLVACGMPSASNQAILSLGRRAARRKKQNRTESNLGGYVMRKVLFATCFGAA